MLSSGNLGSHTLAGQHRPNVIVFAPGRPRWRLNYRARKSALRDGTHPLAVGPVKPRPLIQARQIRPAAPVGARNLGPGRQIVSQDSPNGVSRIGGQAGTQAPDPTSTSPQKHGSRAGSNYPQSPCRIFALYLATDSRRVSAQIIYSGV